MGLFEHQFVLELSQKCTSVYQSVSIHFDTGFQTVSLYTGDMNEKSILVVDDHQEIRDLLGEYLGRQGFHISLADGGEAMRKLLADKQFDLIVLDLMMPGEDGLSLCQYVREINGPPVIMLTAMNEDADCVVGLELGADDYVTKPFSPRVLLARIKTVLRRMSHSNGSEVKSYGSKPQHLSIGTELSQLKFDGWCLDVFQRQLLSDEGVLVSLSNAEFILLEVFLNNPRRVMSRDQLLVLTKGREAEPFDRSIDNQVSRVRKKLEVDPQQPTLIKTVWGGGYMLTSPVTKSRG